VLVLLPHGFDDQLAAVLIDGIEPVPADPDAVDVLLPFDLVVASRPRVGLEE